MTQAVKKIKHVCKCEACGNEAEMVVTCSLSDATQKNDERVAQEISGHASQKVKGTATCTHCGNEADMWVDL